MDIKPNENDNKYADYASILANVYSFIKKYYIILIIFLIVGVLTGIYKSCTHSKSYSKYIILSSGIIDNNIVSDMINSLNLYIDNNTFNSISKKLKISEQAASSITDIKANVLNLNIYNEGLSVQIKFNDNKYIDTVVSSLLNYINNNEFCKRKFELYVNERKNLVKLIDNIIYDTLYLKRNSVNIANLFDKKITYEQDINLNSKVRIVEEFYNNDFKKSYLFKNIVIYSIAFLILGFIISSVIDYVKKVRKFIKNRI